MKPINYVVALLLVFLGSASSQAQVEIQGVLSVTPVLENSCLAAEFELGPGQQLVGLRWYNNDTSAVFPRLLLMEGQADTPPDVQNTGLVLAELSGESLAWGEVMLASPVTSASGIVHAVFELPDYAERSGEGTGYGPGIGYRANTGSERAYLSADGVEWVRVRKDFALAVDPIVVMAKGASPTSLASLKAGVEEGWWTTAEQELEVVTLEEAEEDTQVPAFTSASRPLAASPNPFNPRVTVYFYASTQGKASIAIFDVRGRRVAKLFEDAVEVGEHSVVWDGVDAANRAVASGVYFIRASLPGGSETIRVALVR